MTRNGQTLGYAGRAPSASPACGSADLHRAQQQALVDVALAAGRVEDPGERLEDTTNTISAEHLPAAFPVSGVAPVWRSVCPLRTDDGQRRCRLTVPAQCGQPALRRFRC